MRALLGMRVIPAIVASAVVVAALAGCSGSAALNDQTERSDEGPIRLGLTTALTGTYSEFGVPMKNSIDLVIEQYNDQGGVLGREVELVSYDDQLVAENSQSNMRRLLDEDDVDFVVAPAGSGPTLAVLPLVSAQQKIMMNVIAQAPEAVYPDGEDEPPHDNVFSFALSNTVEAQFMGNYLSENHTKVALIAESTPYGTSGLTQVEKVLEQDGRTRVVAKESYDQQATDVTAQLARIKESGADAIAMIGLGNDTATVRQTMARLGMLDIPFVITAGAGSLPYQERAKELVDGTIVVGYAAFGGGEPDMASAKEFAESYQAAYGNDPYYGDGEWPIPSFGITPASAYDAVKVLLDAIERAGSTDKAAVIEALESGEAFTGARGEYTFSAQEHAAVSTDLLTTYVYRVESDGDVTFERTES